MPDKIKIKVSGFTFDILDYDADDFGFIKNGNTNKNALLNKIIPTLVATRKERREQVDKILTDEYNRKDSESILNAVNTVIDRVYFNDDEVENLSEYIWFRPAKQSLSTYDEIQNSECLITAQDVSVYIRSLLNEYCRLPQYKREALLFDTEFDIFTDACATSQIVHFTDRVTNEKIMAFAYDYGFGHILGNNYCIFYDLKNRKIRSFPLWRLENVYLVKRRYKPSEKLLDVLQNYVDDFNFEKEINVEESGDVF